MSNFHVTEEGPRPCEDTTGRCPYLSEENNHFDTLEEAQAEFNGRMGGSVPKTLKRSAPSPMSELSEEERAQVSSLVPRDGQMKEFFQANDRKHFGEGTPGSTFTDKSLKVTEDVLALAMRQRGNLDGDDREELIKSGSSSTSFLPQCRYLKVSTPGTVGIAHTSTMKDDDVLEVRRTKPGAPVNLVRPVTESPSTDSSVVIIGPSDDDPSKEAVWTTYPGPVTRAARGDGHPELEAREGGTITVSEAKKIIGEDFYANTRIVE